MSAMVRQATKTQVYQLISQYGAGIFDADQTEFFRRCVLIASNVWVGFVDDNLVCIWGLIPPTLLSNQAYLWMYNTEAIKGNEFVFVRQSQIAVKEMLKKYPTICGHVFVSNTRGIRWLKWLGAEFDTPMDKIMSFTIRSAANG